MIKWEDTYHCNCTNQRSLIKFKGFSISYGYIGRPQEPSPKARLFSLLGVEKPFDRHDWTIDRCGKEVRYVIDYYGGEADKEGGDPVFFCDVRPALDSPSAFKDRISSAASWLKSFVFER